MKRFRRKRMPAMIPTASMGDIAFLLTIFFMVCSNFAKEAGLKVTPAQSIYAETVQKGAVTVVIDEKQDVYVDGRRLSNADAAGGALAAIVGSRSTNETTRVMFKCDRKVDRKVFEPVMQAIAEAGGLIVAVGEKPPKRR